MTESILVDQITILLAQQQHSICLDEEETAIEFLNVQLSRLLDFQVVILLERFKSLICFEVQIVCKHHLS